MFPPMLFPPPMPIFPYCLPFHLRSCFLPCYFLLPFPCFLPCYFLLLCPYFHPCSCFLPYHYHCPFLQSSCFLPYHCHHPFLQNSCFLPCYLTCHPFLLPYCLMMYLKMMFQ